MIEDTAHYMVGSILFRIEKKPHAMRVEERKASAWSIKIPPDIIETSLPACSKNQEVFLCRKMTKV